ncbi:protein O-mannose kinase-like [Hetaerina americana]|uniref:protein O-mannose kinase-like n=1 Tax=Hetaerina americana TaxID=62018 RepID=UPI003A7F4F48
MHSCHPFLSCRDFIDVRIGKLIGIGAVKAVYHAKWKEYDVALSVLNNPAFEDDFFTGAENIRIFQHNPLTVQAVGFCDDEKMFLTEFHKNGDASKLMETLKEHPEVNDNSLLRINLCYVYALILVSLHHPGHFTIGNPHLLPRVMCDSNDLKKLLSQFLVTNDFSLILNDMDAIPLVKNGGIKCGHKELKGDFVAPEQLWKLPGNFSDMKQPGYDEKTDIWKAPSVCNYFLGNVSDGNEIKKKLASIHKRCKALVPKDRPTAGDLAEVYMVIKATLNNSTTNK